MRDNLVGMEALAELLRQWQGYIKVVEVYEADGLRGRYEIKGSSDKVEQWAKNIIAWNEWAVVYPKHDPKAAVTLGRYRYTDYKVKLCEVAGQTKFGFAAGQGRRSVVRQGNSGSRSGKAVELTAEARALLGM